jgi:PAS domain S-box-containing protein
MSDSGDKPLQSASDAEQQASREVESVFLRMAMVALAVGSFGFMVVVFTLAPEQPQRVLAPAAMLLVTTFAWLLLRAGRMRQSIQVLAIGAWVLTIGFASINGGVRAPIVATLPLIIIMGGWLLGMRTGITLAALSVIAMLALAVAEHQGMLPRAPATLPMMHWVVQTLVFILAAGVINFLLRAHRRQLDELRRLGNDNLRQRQELAQVERNRCNEVMLDRTGAMAQVGGWEYEVASRQLRWTRECHRLFDIDPSAAPTVERALALYPPPDRERIEAAMLRAIREGVGFDLELQVVTAFGRHIWVRDVGAPELEGGKVVRVSGAVQDVTAQIQVAQMMSSSLENLRRTLDATGDAIFAYDCLDPAGGILFANERFYLLWGIPLQGSATLRGPDIVAVMQDLYLDAELEARRIADICRTNEAHEDRIHLRDGRVIERRSVSIDSAGGSSRVWSFRDVTEQEKVFQSLRESEQRLNQAQEVALLGHFDWDLDNGNLVWSDEHYRLWGLVPGSAVPSMEVFRQAVHPDDLPRLDAIFESIKAGKRGYDWNHCVVWPDGSIHYMHGRGEAEFAADGRVRRIIGTVQDVTERRLVEEELRAALDEAEAANRAKSEFLSRMSHELRTPLNAILGFGQLLQMPDDHPLSAQQTENVGEILRAGEHLLAQVDEVLDLSRIESGRIELSPTALALGPCIDACLALVSPLAERRQLHVSTQIPADAAVLADGNRLRQVLLNLVSNAVKYNRDGGMVGITARRVDEAWRVEVTDSGRGIAEANLGRLFQAFERLESAYDAIEGTGIGLALAKRLVEAMRGRIGVSSVAGEGSCFWFELPGVAIAGADAGVVAAQMTTKVGAGSTASASSPRKAGKVLHIEDNPANRKLMQSFFAALPDYDLIDANSAWAGIELARREQPRLILLDINLPGMSGFDALALLREIPGLKRVPVIAVTANAMQGDVERGLAAGFDAYLTKPLDMFRLRQLVDGYLGSIRNS